MVYDLVKLTVNPRLKHGENDTVEFLQTLLLVEFLSLGRCYGSRKGHEPSTNGLMVRFLGQGMKNLRPPKWRSQVHRRLTLSGLGCRRLRPHLLGKLSHCRNVAG